MRAGCAKPFELRRSGIGADDHDPQILRSRIRAQFGEEFVPMNVGQVEVEQHEVRLMLAREFQSNASVRGGNQVHPWTSREDALNQAEIGSVVFDVKQRAWSRAGSRNQPRGAERERGG